MLAVRPVKPLDALTRIFDSMTLGAWENSNWSPTEALKPFLAFLTALCMALYILSYPEKHRKLSIFIFALPISYACYHHTLLVPCHSICDTFGRFMYIWLARMSHEVILLKWTPPVVKGNDGWRTRFKIALKVLYSRSPEDDVLHPRRRHSYSRTQFLAYHAGKAMLYYFLQVAYSVLTAMMIRAEPASSLTSPFAMASFFRRLPASLDGAELWIRLDNVIVWCVINLWLYDGFHSVCALFFVGLGLDEPWEWSMSLFGPLSVCWSVRNYWGKHWHNYIYMSFSSHVKLVTRGWLGMRRGRVSTRLMENTMVFAASGVMHTLIRYIQSGSEGGDCWVITLWYVGQMVPIIIEDIVQHLWRAKKKELGIKDTTWLRRTESVLGYLWVIGFNAWSIPKYDFTKRSWGSAAMMVRYKAMLEEYKRNKAVAATPSALEAALHGEL